MILNLKLIIIKVIIQDKENITKINGMVLEKVTAPIKEISIINKNKIINDIFRLLIRITFGDWLFLL